MAGSRTWAPPGAAAVYDEVFAPLCAGPVAMVLDAVRERHPAARTLLDVGTGTGALAGAAASRGYDVTGVDPDQSMLAVARKGRAGHGAQWVAGGLPDLPFAAGRFDVVTANFVVNHLDDPRAGIAGLARVCAERGVVAVTTWPEERAALPLLWDSLLAGAGLTAQRYRLPAELDFPRTEPGLAGVLAGVGLAGVETATVTWGYAVTPEQLWRAVTAGLAIVGSAYREADGAGRARLRATYRDQTAALVDEAGVLHFETPAVLALGTPAA